MCAPRQERKRCSTAVISEFAEKIWHPLCRACLPLIQSLRKRPSPWGHDCTAARKAGRGALNSKQASGVSAAAGHARAPQRSGAPHCTEHSRRPLLVKAHPICSQMANTPTGNLCLLQHTPGLSLNPVPTLFVSPCPHPDLAPQPFVGPQLEPKQAFPVETPLALWGSPPAAAAAAWLPAAAAAASLADAPRSYLPEADLPQGSFWGQGSQSPHPALQLPRQGCGSGTAQAQHRHHPPG